MLKLSSDIIQLNRRLEEAENCGVKEAEMEDAKKRLADKTVGLEQQLETALSKCVGLEKVRNRLQSELQSLTAEFDKVNAKI